MQPQLRKHISTTPEALIKELYYRKGHDAVNRIMAMIGQELGGRCIYDELNKCYRYFHSTEEYRSIEVQILSKGRSHAGYVLLGVSATGKRYTAIVDFQTYREEFANKESDKAIFVINDHGEATMQGYL